MLLRLLILDLVTASYSHSMNWAGGDGCIEFRLSPISLKASLVKVCTLSCLLVIELNSPHQSLADSQLFAHQRNWFQSFLLMDSRVSVIWAPSCLTRADI